MAKILNLAFLAFSSGESSGGLLDVNPGLIFWVVITFVLLLVLLKKIAWGPILNSLNERESFIKDSLEKAEKAQRDAEKLLEENKANLAKAESEAQKIIEQGREYSDKLKSQLLAEAKSTAQKMIAEASSEIERKNREAFNNLKEEVANIAVDAAEKIIRANLDKEKQTKLINDYLDNLNKN
ncbi:MAG: ATP synthase F0 subunit B [Ignavibacteriales bacterium CG18_big_fil_WC_8_21_14_2_50_31_20]|nr:MAG: ATP synthase F0 subunit B [Ignavibacteriales bacterium CG18_big_fil_WC_8_21_14_2_50_31_20]